MSKNLLIVESPAKVKTIGKVLGRDFTVMASYGHVRDLPSKNGSVDTAHDFAMKYQVIDRNEKHVDAIVKAARVADTIWLATDLDREGESISWHVAEILREKKLLQNKTINRVTFAEITPRAITEAIAKPRKLSMHMVNAQQARRALDYLFGFELSPVLWRKVQRGLSAGRVQSPALRMVVEREDEIERFIRREYWTLEADLEKGNTFSGKLILLDGRKLEQFDVNHAEHAHAVRDRLHAQAKGELEVVEVQRRDRQRRPAAPFITSTLQQEAARKLGFSAKRTMRVAQDLYEGIVIDGGQTGLITYMRTDSVSLSRDSLGEIRDAITQQYGADKLPPAPNVYQSKSKNAQEAHEAIRPTSALRTPESVRRFLDSDHYRLYELIWKRTLASQMRPALLNTVSVDMACGNRKDVFRSTGTTVLEPGFLAVYEEGKDDAKDEEGGKLPLLTEGDRVRLLELRAEQHFTEPPPRYSEASLVKELEEYGIGRPSTYASILGVLVDREYVTLNNKRFFPTDVGRVVSRFLSTHFTQYVDYEFTARLEDELDAVSRGEADHLPVLQRFWEPFKALVESKSESVSRAEATASRVLGVDPASGREVSVRLSRFGPCAQIGLATEEEKPRFASLRPGQKMDSITLAEALHLFKLPRKLGMTAEGEEVTVAIGRFGPFAKAGSTYASLAAEDDPYEISLERALTLIEDKRAGINARLIASFDGGIQVVKGKFGPYITDGSKNAKIPKDREPASLTHEECLELLASAPEKARGRFARKGAAKADGKGRAPAKKAPAKRPAAKPAASKTATSKPAASKPAASKPASPPKTAIKAKPAAKKSAAKKSAPKTAASKASAARKRPAKAKA